MDSLNRFIYKASSPAHGRIGLRPAGQSDISFIACLSKKVFNIYGPYDEMVPDWLGLDTTVTIIAQKEKQACGFAMIGDLFNRYDFPAASEILAIAVDPLMQRKGVGNMLIRELERKAAELGIRRLFLHTATGNIKARRLFTGNGYRPWEIKREFYPEGQDAVVMSREITRYD